MMKKSLLLGLALIPFFLGGVMHLLILNDWLLVYKFLGIFFLPVWAFLGSRLCQDPGSAKKATLLAHIPALAVLLLLLYQELVTGQYWGNPIGIATQFYYLPLLGLAHSFTFWTEAVWPAYIISFLLLCGAFYYGCTLKKRQES